MSEAAATAECDKELLTAWTDFITAGQGLVGPAAETTFRVLEQGVATLGAWLPHAHANETDQAEPSGKQALVGDTFAATGNSTLSQLRAWCATIHPVQVGADQILEQSAALHQFRVHLTTLLDFMENGTPHASDRSQPIWWQDSNKGTESVNLIAISAHVVLGSLRQPLNQLIEIVDSRAADRHNLQPWPENICKNPWPLFSEIESWLEAERQRLAPLRQAVKDAFTQDRYSIELLGSGAAPRPSEQLGKVIHKELFLIRNRLGDTDLIDLLEERTWGGIAADVLRLFDLQSDSALWSDSILNSRSNYNLEYYHQHRSRDQPSTQQRFRPTQHILSSLSKLLIGCEKSLTRLGGKAFLVDRSLTIQLSEKAVDRFATINASSDICRRLLVANERFRPRSHRQHSQRHSEPTVSETDSNAEPSPKRPRPQPDSSATSDVLQLETLREAFISLESLLRQLNDSANSLYSSCPAIRELTKLTNDASQNVAAAAYVQTMQDTMSAIAVHATAEASSLSTFHQLAPHCPIADMHLDTFFDGALVTVNEIARRFDELLAVLERQLPELVAGQLPEVRAGYQHQLDSLEFSEVVLTCTAEALETLLNLLDLDPRVLATTTDLRERLAGRLPRLRARM